MPPRQLRFDSVLVAPPGTREYSRPASDGTVQYTSREVAADLGRRCLKLRDVARVSYGDNDGSPPALEVRGKGKCSSLRCSLDLRDDSGAGRREFLSFAEDLVAAHKKALKKAGLPDPYGDNDGSKTTGTTAARGGIGGRKSAALTERTRAAPKNSEKKTASKTRSMERYCPLPRRRPILCARYCTEVSTTTPSVDL